MTAFSSYWFAWASASSRKSRFSSSNSAMRLPSASTSLSVSTRSLAWYLAYRWVAASAWFSAVGGWRVLTRRDRGSVFGAIQRWRVEPVEGKGQ